MKKLLLMLAALSLQSCATIVGGKIDTCQKRKPIGGEEQRKIRVGYLIVGIVFPVSGIVDFATAAIYKPCEAAK